MKVGKIEKGIPLRLRTTERGTFTGTLESMEVGDSFLLYGDDGDVKKLLSRCRSNIFSVNYRNKLKGEPSSKVFKAGSGEIIDGVAACRVWRVE